MVPDDGDSTIRPSYIALLADNDKDKEKDTAVCYTGGFAVKQVYQMCDVTSTSASTGSSFVGASDVVLLQTGRSLTCCRIGHLK